MIKGFVEHCTEGAVSGWCVDTSKKSPVRLSICYGGQEIGTTHTGHMRSDVGQFYSNPASGFYFALPRMSLGRFEPSLISVWAAGYELERTPVSMRPAYSAGEVSSGQSDLRLSSRLTDGGNTDPAYTHAKLSSEWGGLQCDEAIVPITIKKNSGRYFTYREALSDRGESSRVSQLSPWMYYFKFRDCSTSDFPHTYDSDVLTMHDLRSDLITQSLRDLYGSELKDMSVLDLGCNCGIFSFDMASLGVKRVVGIDVFDRNIEQAKYLKELLGFSNVEFMRANVKDFRSERFDIVLNLGLMYHLSNPFEVMEWCHEIADRAVVVDTLCHKDAFPGFFSTYKPRKESGIEGDAVFELQPTYRAIVDLIDLVGFGDVREYVSTDVQKMVLYKDLLRRCFFCFKSPLSK